MSMSKNIGRSLNASKTINFVERVDLFSQECEEKQSIFTVTAKVIMGKHFKRRAKYFEPKNVGSLKNLFIFCHVDEDTGVYSSQNPNFGP